MHPVGLASISPPPGLEHLAGLAPPPGLNASGHQQISLVDLAPPPGLEAPGKQQAKPLRPPGVFTPPRQQATENHCFDVETNLAKAPTYSPPPGDFSLVQPQWPTPSVFQSPFDFFRHDEPVFQQPLDAFTHEEYVQPPLPKQPMRPPGNWDNISCASTALTDDASNPALGSPRRAPSVSSDEGGILPFRSILEDFMPENIADNCVHEVEQSTKKEQSEIHWPVDARKLGSKDKQIISPSFQISPHASVKIMIKPKSVGDRKGQASFHKAKGIGSLEVKSVEESTVAPTIRFCVSVGGQASYGPVKHDFGNGVCILPTEWDFRSAVDSESSSFLVSLQVLDVV